MGRCLCDHLLKKIILIILATPPPEEVIQRTTPLAFTRPHAAASFNKAGGFLTVVGPKQPLDGEIAFVQNAKIEVCQIYWF